MNKSVNNLTTFVEDPPDLYRIYYIVGPIATKELVQSTIKGSSHANS